MTLNFSCCWRLFNWNQRRNVNGGFPHETVKDATARERADHELKIRSLDDLFDVEKKVRDLFRGVAVDF